MSEWKRYSQECELCSDRLYWELKSYIQGVTHYSLVGRQYIDLQVILHKMNEIELRNEDVCHCTCPLCDKCDQKDGE